VSTSALVLAQEGSRNPGPVPLLIVVLLGIATVLLIRNMNGRLKRLPREFPDQQVQERPEDEPTP
jgi:hypothetical protein